MSKSTNLENLADVIKQELTIYSNAVTEGIKKQAQDSMKELVNQTKKTAPVGKRKKHYKNSIKSKKLEENDRGVKYVWFVEGSNARLSHLIEKGHALRNGGRTRATNFIKNASERILTEYEEKIEEVIKNGK